MPKSSGVPHETALGFYGFPSFYNCLPRCCSHCPLLLFAVHLFRLFVILIWKLSSLAAFQASCNLICAAVWLTYRRSNFLSIACTLLLSLTLLPSSSLSTLIGLFVLIDIFCFSIKSSKKIYITPALSAVEKVKLTIQLPEDHCENLPVLFSSYSGTHMENMEYYIVQRLILIHKS